jgi:hypothetical protein
MDSWAPNQLALMKSGGNRKCAEYLKSKGVDPTTPIKQKYESGAAQLYKEVLKARVEGRPEPTELPKPVARTPPVSGGYSGGAVGKPGEDPNGMERLSGETEAQYVARQIRLRDEAKARMAAKFGNGGMGGVGSSRMSGIGSDPNYNPNAGYSGGYGADLNVDGLVAGFGSALSSLGSAAKGAAAAAQSMIHDEQTQRSFQNMGSSITATGGSFWSTFSSSVSQVAASLSQPDGGDGLEDFNRQMHAQASTTGTKYAGFGSDNNVGGLSTGPGISGAAPTTALQEAPGLPGEDRNGIERLTGESDEQYIMRQTRLRDEAKARMAAKFGGGGLSSASSSSFSGAQSAPSSGPLNHIAATPINTPGKASPPRPTPAEARSAPASGNWGGVVAQQSKPTKLKVESPDDFFASFGA